MNWRAIGSVIGGIDEAGDIGGERERIALGDRLDGGAGAQVRSSPAATRSAARVMSFAWSVMSIFLSTDFPPLGSLS